MVARPGSEVQDQLKEVREIRSNKGSFVAILADGSVVSWGHKGHGADSSEVRDQRLGFDLGVSENGLHSTVFGRF